MSNNPFLPGNFGDLADLAGMKQRQDLINQQEKQNRILGEVNRGLQAKLSAIEAKENERIAIENKRLELEISRIESEKAQVEMNKYKQKQAHSLRQLLADAIAQLDELHKSMP